MEVSKCGYYHGWAVLSTSCAKLISQSLLRSRLHVTDTLQDLTDSSDPALACQAVQPNMDRLVSPMPALDSSQTVMIGAKAAAILEVPMYCTLNSTTSTTMVTPMTSPCCREGMAMCRPLTADSTVGHHTHMYGPTVRRT